MKVTTQQAKIPWLWTVYMSYPWVVFLYSEFCSGMPLTFTMRKFIENPGLISFLASLNVAFNFLVGVITSFMSDRIWTRFGRRRPFLILGWAGVAVAMTLVPLAQNIWQLFAIIVFYQFCQDVAKPYEPLFNEVIPAAQRGRAATVRNIMQHLVIMFFFTVLLGKFDKKYDIGTSGLAITGEMMIYWLGTLAMVGSVAFLLFGIREVMPPEGIDRTPVTVRGCIRDIFGNRHAWMVYMLYACPSIAGAGTATLIPLLQTEQIGFTKQQVGWAAGIGTPFSLLLFIPLAGYLADRMSRVRMFQLGIAIPAAIQLVLFFYLRYVVNYQIALSTWIVFGLTGAAFSTMMNLVWGPLVYDYIPSNRMGTISAGFSFISGITGFVFMNLGGQWVLLWTRLFGPAGAAKYDYSGLYVLSFALAMIALAITILFQREVNKGRVIPYGQIEQRRAHNEQQPGCPVVVKDAEELAATGSGVAAGGRNARRA